MKEYQQEFLLKATELYGNGPISRSEAMNLASNLGHGYPHWFLSKRNVGRNQYSIDYGNAMQQKWGDKFRKQETNENNLDQEIKEENKVVPFVQPTQQPQPHITSQTSFIPESNPFYVKAGHFKEIVQIIKSRQFLPTYITGLSGMGKTQEVTEACASLKRDLVRVNITIETDEDDLLGHYTLRNGETIWEDGPVVVAMERGAILLLDEVDLASNKIMCLQPILEGSPIYLKKINRLVKPAAGFNIFATANTKGKGSDDGRFIGANVMNEAFLDRFPLTFEQQYPSVKVEQKILNQILASANIEDEEFVTHLCNWADVIRRTFFDGGVDEIISTRRLINIIQTYIIFQNKQKAIEYSINRFDDDTKASFMDLYTKVDPTVEISNPQEPKAEQSADDSSDSSSQESSSVS